MFFGVYSIPHTPTHISLIGNSQLPGVTEAWFLTLANTFKWYISPEVACNYKLCNVINTDSVNNSKSDSIL